MARRVPAWVWILAFAVVAGGLVGLAAYVRGRKGEDFCRAKRPSTALVSKLAGHDVLLVPQPGCATHYRRDVRGKSELVVIRKRPVDYMARLRELERELQLVSETIATDPGMQAAILETTVQATAAKRVGLIGKGDDVVELHFDPAIFGKDQALEVMREVATR